jgi:hypothetical protein
VVTSDSDLKAGAVRGARGFYARALSETEQQFLEDAMGVEGLDQEIAVLRLRLLEAVEEHPKDIDLMFKGVALLARLVQTKFNLSKEDAGDLRAAIGHAVVALREMYPVVADLDPVDDLDQVVDAPELEVADA